MHFTAKFEKKHGYEHEPGTLFVPMLEYLMDSIHPKSHFRGRARGKPRNKFPFAIEPGHGGHGNAERTVAILHSYIEKVKDDAEDDYL